jgi:hypothetical protein
MVVLPLIVLYSFECLAKFGACLAVISKFLLDLLIVLTTGKIK